MTSTTFWFLLVDSATGQPYKGTTVDFVSLPPGAVVTVFRDAVHVENASILTSIAPSQLFVYTNKAAFEKRNNDEDDGKEQPLKPSRNLNGLGESEEEALIVVVSSLISSTQTTTNLCLANEPSNKRIQRWDELNEILARHPETSGKSDDDSTSFWNVTYSQVKSAFGQVKMYDQPKRAVDDNQLDFLAQYLSYTTKCFWFVTGSSVKHLHFVAPILICVCSLLKGDVELVADEEVVGKYVQARCRFDFMLKRKTKAVCVVLAKKYDFEQGKGHVIVGCEALAELQGLDVVYGIVTNYVGWVFIRSRNDKVEMDECSIGITHHGPGRESLKTIAEKIYSILADEDTQTE
ncbi:hypothetical protein ACHAW6_002413 [Cyclotella cf. meneghiniana]